MQHSVCSHPRVGTLVHSQAANIQCRTFTRSPQSWIARTQPTRCAHSSSSSSSTAEVSTSGASAADIAAAWSNLKDFTQKEIKGMAQQYLSSASSRAKLKHDLMLAYRHPCKEESWTPELNPEVLLGVVASDSRLAVRALRDWCLALGLQYIQPDCKVAGASGLAAVKGGVYVKYNSRSQVCYMTQYSGRDRGVLIQLGPGRLLGHFPLGFFDEGMANPEPSLGEHSAAAPSSS